MRFAFTKIVNVVKKMIENLFLPLFLLIFDNCIVDKNN